MTGEVLSIPEEGGFAAVRRIAELLREAGGRALLVGGCVRDLFTGRTAKDLDLEVYGLDAEAVQKAVSGEFPLDPVGMSFGVMKVRHLPIDIALPRRESKTGAGHRGFLVSAVPDLPFAEAAARRDFTVNAMMCDPLTGEVIDPWGGREDLRRGILRHVSEHFAEDPLRVLRGMQFIARFGLAPAPETVKACSGLSQTELAVERIGAEWDKLLLTGVRISAGLGFLRDCRWIEFYPELAALPEADWCATLVALDRFAGKRRSIEADDRALGAAVLCAKLPEKAPGLLARIWRRNELAETVPPLLADLTTVCAPLTDGDLRRCAVRARRMDLLTDLAECVFSETAAELAAIRARCTALGILSAPPEPILQGRHLIARGFRGGPEMGAVLKRCFEAQLDGAFSDLAGAEDFLTRLLAEKH